MEAIWNRAQLERPPNVTCYVKRQEFDAKAFLTTLEKIISDLTSQKLLHKEAAFLSRIIYRTKTKFRTDKGIKCMLKVNKALLNYLSLRLNKDYENLKEFVEINGNNVMLPSKQMVEYVLVRTQGFARLMLRVEEVSKCSAHFLRTRISTGQAWIIAVVAYSIISRIWILSRYIVKQSCTWYNDLYKYVKLLSAAEVPWLPDNYELTSDLKVWLSVPWINEPIPSVPSSYGLQRSMFKLIIPHAYESNEDFTFNVENNSKQISFEDASLIVEKENVISTPIPKSGNKNIISDDDTGEIIDRHTFSFKHNEHISRVSKEKKHNEVIKKKRCHQVSTDSGSITQINDFKNINNESPNQLYKNSTVNPSVAKKKISDQLLTFEKVKNKSDIITLLNRESYPGLEKLQWNMMRNKGKRLLNKLDAYSNALEQSVLLKKIIKRMQSWIT